MKDRLEVAANVAMLLAAVVFIAFFGRQGYESYRHPASAAQLPAQAPLVGRTVSLPGMSFAPGGTTLLLAISTTCHFCKDSEPFYRALAARNRGRVKLVAVLPQPLAEAQSYVHNSIAPSVQAVSSGLDTIGVRGTPTLLLVDGDGKVRQAWVGKLSEEGQKEVQALVM